MKPNASWKRFGDQPSLELVENGLFLCAAWAVAAPASLVKLLACDSQFSEEKVSSLLANQSKDV